MNKQKYRKHQNQRYRMIKANIQLGLKVMNLTGELKEATDKAEYYKKRFRKFGSNVDTTDLESGKIVCMVKWTLTPEVYGQYARLDPHFATSIDYGKEIERLVTTHLVEGLIDNELVQFIWSSGDDHELFGKTVGAKLYVVPWEQMPHSKIIEMKQYVDGWLESR